jgi:uncharacterized small protein (DUF1192 family)
MQSKSLQVIESHRQKIQHLKELLSTNGTKDERIGTMKTTKDKLSSNPQFDDDFEIFPIPPTSFTNALFNEKPGNTIAQSRSAPILEEPMRTRKPTSPGSNVDFEAVLGELFCSLEDMKVPIKTRGNSPFRNGNGSKTSQDDSDLFLLSIAEVDARLAELNREKQRIRDNLLSKI